MKISELLTPSQILLPFAAADKWAAIRAMPVAWAEAGHLPPALLTPATDALLARERSVTTGMENGIAIPHAALPGLDRLLALLVIAPDGIDFGTLDGTPGQLLVGLLIPPAEKLQHIRTLAAIARLLGRREVRSRLLECKSPDQALTALADAER